jgi:hypothetical protein
MIEQVMTFQRGYDLVSICLEERRGSWLFAILHEGAQPRTVETKVETKEEGIVLFNQCRDDYRADGWRVLDEIEDALKIANPL